jgi:hypothetical protein
MGKDPKKYSLNFGKILFYVYYAYVSTIFTKQRELMYIGEPNN